MIANHDRECEVLVAGAGPTGLVLAVLLAQADVDVVLLERRTTPSDHSRAIGLHPPALSVLARLGLDEAATAEGVQVRAGMAYSQGRKLGELSFEVASPDRPFVLTLPQQRTEALLRERLSQLAPRALHDGWEIVDVADQGEQAAVLARSSAAGDERDVVWHARTVIGADGAGSIVRERARTHTDSRQLPDTYMMGDFPDHTGHGHRAAIYLEPNGVVESFPLPDSDRRWVVHTGTVPTEPSAAELAAIVERRTGETPEPDAATMVSSFTVRRRIAKHMITQRDVIIGDAAHEISPIGGQGMTLGWLDALRLAPLLIELIAEGRYPSLREVPGFRQFEQDRLLAARTAARQAELNMMLGRPTCAALHQIRKAMLATVLATPLRHRLARKFTMRTGEYS